MSDLLHITIDTREQTPWHFEPWQARSTIGTLKTGDYAITGDHGFAVERKSLDDFLGTISTGWARFQREVWRARDAGFPVLPVVVEGSLSTCCFRYDGEAFTPPEHNHPRLSPAFVVKRVAELTLMGCAVIWAENAQYAAAIGYAILKERAEFLKKGDE